MPVKFADNSVRVRSSVRNELIINPVQMRDARNIYAKSEVVRFNVELNRTNRRVLDKLI